jgi:hypothetical protein
MKQNTIIYSALKGGKVKGPENGLIRNTKNVYVFQEEYYSMRYHKYSI